MNLNDFTLPQLRLFEEIVDKSVEHWKSNIKFLWDHMDKEFWFHSHIAFPLGAPDLSISVSSSVHGLLKDFMHFGASHCSCCHFVKDMMDKNGDNGGTLLCKKYCPLSLFSEIDCSSPGTPWMNFFDHLKKRKENFISASASDYAVNVLKWIMGVQETIKDKIEYKIMKQVMERRRIEIEKEKARLEEERKYKLGLRPKFVNALPYEMMVISEYVGENKSTPHKKKLTIFGPRNSGIVTFICPTGTIYSITKEEYIQKYIIDRILSKMEISLMIDKKGKPDVQ